MNGRTDWSEKLPYLHHPRPQLRRETYRMLDGEWELNGGRVRVPFPPESPAGCFSGEMGTTLTYETRFVVPREWRGGRILLHFGAVDQIAEVWLNDVFLGRHEGGYLGFSFDITEALAGASDAAESAAALFGAAEQRLRVVATDELSTDFPYGKQSGTPGGMWYTPVSGIWKSVWIEAVPETYVRELRMTPDPRGVRVKVFLVDGGSGRVSSPVAGTLDCAPANGADRASRAGAACDIAVRLPDVSGEWIPCSGTEFYVNVAETAARCGLDDASRAMDCRELDGASSSVDCSGMDDAPSAVECRGLDSELVGVSGAAGCHGRSRVAHPRLWTPDDPYLYRLQIRAGSDFVETYFGLRTIEAKTADETDDGVPGIFLNGRRIFLNGVLDQGYFPEGIYVPAEAEEYARDIVRMKELGFNLLRKHVKVEPAQFYYACDALGMLVMQDMVNSGEYSYVRDTLLPNLGFLRRSDSTRRGGICRTAARRDAAPSAECVLSSAFSDAAQPSAEQVDAPQIDGGRAANRRRIFVSCLRGTLRELHNYPCVIAYTIFNEGWGQFDSDRLYRLAKKLDPSRFYDAASGWFAQSESDVDSVHVYFRNKRLRPKCRPMLLTECGGFSLEVPGHMWKEKRYGYGACANSEALTERILALYRKMVRPAVAEGLCGVVYTQLSDVEEEINGLYTYDREICKVIPEKLRSGITELFG